MDDLVTIETPVANCEDSGITATGIKPLPPTRQEMKAAIKDPSTPDVVRRYLKQQLYGEGGQGRKAEQQRGLQARVHRLRQEQRHQTEGLRRPDGMSGRQFKKARRLIRQGVNQVLKNS